MDQARPVGRLKAVDDLEEEPGRIGDPERSVPRS